MRSGVSPPPCLHRRQESYGAYDAPPHRARSWAWLSCRGIHVKRDTQLSIAYSQELIFSMSVTLQSTDRHHGIVGQEHCHFQRDS
jgi:hypothetical protein